MSPFLRVWTDPRGTIRDLATSGSGNSFLPLAAIYGATHNLNQVVVRGIDPSQGVTSVQVLGANVAFGALFGIGALYAMSFPLSWVGRRLGGVAPPRTVRTVLAWSSVPFIPLLVLAVALALLGPSTFLVRTAGSTPPPTFGPYLVAWGILGVWLCIIGVAGLSEVHAFSVGRSVATYLIVVGGFVVVLLGIIALVVATQVSS
jgi:hypothetical protein